MKRLTEKEFLDLLAGPIPADFKLTPEEEAEFLTSGPQVYDKAKWHFEGDFPEGLKQQQAYVCAGMYLRWLIEMEFVDEEFLEEIGFDKLGKKKGSQLYKKWGGVLDSDMLTARGNRFTREYYDRYLRDFHRLLGKGLPSDYHVEESDANYAVMRDCIRERFEVWRKRRRERK